MAESRIQHTAFEKVRILQQKLYLAARAEPKRKFGVLYDKVCSNRILGMDHAQAKTNNGASGVDRVTSDSIENGIGTGIFLRDIQTCAQGIISKVAGRLRLLGIPVIADRVIQASMKMVIEPLFETGFKD